MKWTRELALLVMATSVFMFMAWVGQPFWATGLATAVTVFIYARLPK
jgi:hypothetical protein